MSKKHPAKIWLIAAVPVVIAAGFLFLPVIKRVTPGLGTSYLRTNNVIKWLNDAGKYPDWAIQAGDRCGSAPFIYPTSGFVGYLWNDSWRLGQRHQGIDIFGGGEVGATPVIAAYSGYLTREPDWKSSLIIRVPQDPLQPSRQIWTYYTHLADQQGNSLIEARFPAGIEETYVEAGTLLGYQGNYSGDPQSPVGVHLHFSIVLGDNRGFYRNELEIANTLDPTPYLGLPLHAWKNRGEIPLCQAAQ